VLKEEETHELIVNNVCAVARREKEVTKGR